MYKTNIFNCNIELLEKQKQELINEIVYGQPNDYFKIFSMEAGTGKTRTAEYALAKMVKETRQNAIFVRAYNSNCEESAARINDLVEEKVALPFYNEGKSKEERTAKQKDFTKYRILVITHQRFLELSRNSSQRNVFTKGRSTLVIDEYINDVNKLNLTTKKLNSLKAILMCDPTLYCQYLKIISKIEDIFLLDRKTNGYLQLRITNDFSTIKEINYLNKLIRANVDSAKIVRTKESILNLDGLDISLLNEISTVSKLRYEIENLKEFFNQAVIMHDEVLYAPDSRIGYWFLGKNFILDAAAELQPAYITNPNKFRIVNKEKVLDHSGWMLINVVANSTLSGKEKIENYYEKVNQYLSENFDTDNILIVSNKNDVSCITAVREENRTYFGNLIGSNDWAELKNVAIIQTPNIGDVDYLMKYLHNMRDFLKATTFKWTTRKKGKGVMSTHAFSDEEMEKIRVNFIAEQIYQAVKRVNRSMEGETKVVLICNNEKVVKLVGEHLRGCKFQRVNDIGFTSTESKQEQYIIRLQEDSYANKFITLLAELSAGKHQELVFRDKDCLIGKKKRLREQIGMSNAANFNHQVLVKTNVILYCETRSISLQGQNIKIPIIKKVVPNPIKSIL